MWAPAWEQRAYLAIAGAHSGRLAVREEDA
jgi:hypothetical protein